MKKKRLSADSRSSSLQWSWGWFGELPPQIRVIVIGVVAVGIILMLLPKSLFHTFNCNIQNLPQNYWSSNNYYIDNQVIVVGRGEDVDDVIGTPTPIAPTTPGTPATGETLSVVGTPAGPGAPATPVATATPVGSEKVILNLIEDCDLSYLDSRKALDAKTTREPRKLVMRLYEIPKESTVETVISEIDDKAQGREIFADPNYFTRLSDSTSDPCIRQGDGGGTGGGPFGNPSIPDPRQYNAEAARNEFMNQWAFGKDGINLTAWMDSTSSNRLSGREVRVGVFDTSPYRISFPFIGRVAEAFPSPLWFTAWDAGGTTTDSNHGLFVAGLIHRVAPKSRIQLIRVLDDDGCGDLWTLNKGLEDYMSRMSAWEGNLDGTVINMSLGIRVPEPAEDNDTGLEQDDPNLAENDSGPEAEPDDTTPEANNDEESEDLETLKSLIIAADQMGAIIVAAAGNDSTRTREPNGNIVEQIVDMQIPASYPNVIGVVATNQRRQRSCYSNRRGGGNERSGEDEGVMVAAPGGGGGEDPDDPANLCASRTQDSCTDMANCEYGLISLAQTRYGPQYVLWSGTSFAAPLVSGLAALAYEEGERDQVLCMIVEGSSVKQAGLSTPDDEVGWGLINVAESLSPTVLSRCGVSP